MKKLKKPQLAINLVTWQGKNYLLPLLKSIEDQTFKDFSILVIDNHSTDQTVSLIKENFPQIKIIINKTNVGFAKAHNQAISWTASKYILCLNQDLILDKNFLKYALDFLEKNQEAAAVTGKILKWDFQKNEPTKIIDSTGLKILKNHQVLDRGQGEIDTGQADEINEIFGVSGTCPIYRRAVLEKIKYHLEYFDENFFSYKEDIDLAFRLRLAGYKSFYLPQAIVYHQRSTGIAKTKNKEIIRNRRQHSKFINYHSYKNHLFVLVKNEFFINIIKYFPWLFFYELKKFLYILLFEQKTLKTLSKFFKSLPLMLKKRRFIKKNICLIKPKDLNQWYE